MTKLWPYEVGAKIGDCSNVATLRTNVATLQKQSIPTSRRSRSVLGGFLAHFEPIMEGFKSSNPKETRRRWLRLGEGDFVHTLGPKGKHMSSLKSCSVINSIFECNCNSSLILALSLTNFM